MAGATGPIGALAASESAGCLREVMTLWATLVLIPIGLMWVAARIVEVEDRREQAKALFGAIAIVGYFLSAFASLLTVNIRQLVRI